MITKQEIQTAIDNGIKKQNEGLEEYNAQVRKNNVGKQRYRAGWQSEKSELRLKNMIDELSYYSKDGLFGDLTFEEVEQVGGEDQGSHYHVVYLVTNTVTGDTAHIYFEGYYSSYDGTEFDGDFDVVTPVKKMVEVTEWEKV